MADYDPWWDPTQFSVSQDFSVPDFGYDFQFPDFNIPDFDFSQFNLGFDPTQFEVPTFDPGQFDLGFDPTFDLGQYSAGLSDPFSIPTGDLTLPDFDLSGFLAGNVGQSGGFMPSMNAMGTFNFDSSAISPAFDFGAEPAFNLGDTSSAFPDLAFDIGEGGSPLDASLFGSNVGGGFERPDLSGLQDYTTPGPMPVYSSLVREGGPPPKAPGTSSADELRDAQAGYYKTAPLLGLGQLGLGLSGGLMAAFGPQPQPRKPTDLENAKTQAEIDAIRAKIDLEREALAQKAEMAGSEGEIAALQAETAIKIQAMKAESDRLLAEMTRERPLFEMDPRFSTLYNETTGAQQALSPDNPEIQQMTQQIYSTRRAGAAQQYQEQRDAILERANRLGTNPAAELAQINEAEQQADSALLVEAQQTALAFAQSRLDPSQALLQAILKTVV